MPAISAAKNTSLILHGVGLIVIYSMYGVLQEGKLGTGKGEGLGSGRTAR